MIRALTQTLLPEPVAPATRRWGIFGEVDPDRAPRHVAAEGERQRARRGEHLCLLDQVPGSRRPRSFELGISIPTTSLPGIGASIRIERADRAIARSSARASIRETLTWCSGLILVLGSRPGRSCTSRPWPGSRSSAASPRSASLFDSWSMVPTVRAPGGVSSSIGGRVQSIAWSIRGRSARASASEPGTRGQPGHPTRPGGRRTGPSWPTRSSGSMVADPAVGAGLSRMSAGRRGHRGFEFRGGDGPAAPGSGGTLCCAGG